MANLEAIEKEVKKIVGSDPYVVGTIMARIEAGVTEDYGLVNMNDERISRLAEITREAGPNVVSMVVNWERWYPDLVEEYELTSSTEDIEAAELYNSDYGSEFRGV